VEVRPGAAASRRRVQPRSDVHARPTAVFQNSHLDDNLAIVVAVAAAVAAAAAASPIACF
jgi:hypothetical protein